MVHAYVLIKWTSRSYRNFKGPRK